MGVRSVFWSRLAGVLGAVCLGISILLVPMGVRIVRAEDEASPSVPESAAPVGPSASEAETSPKPAPAAAAAPVAPAPRSVEIDPVDELIPLNTTGYNYKPDRQVRDTP